MVDSPTIPTPVPTSANDVGRALLHLEMIREKTPVYDGNDPRAIYYRQRLSCLDISKRAIEKAVEAGLMNKEGNFV